MSEAEDVSDDSSKLDELSIQILNLMKDYINCKLNIQNLIKDGSLELAKSRYIMGNKSVSSLQLPTEATSDIVARTTVKESLDVDVITLEVSRLTLQEQEQVAADQDHQGEQEEDEDSTQKCRRTSQDPLKWFGVLVPQNLRFAQSSFNRAIDYVVQCVNIQLELHKLQENYKQLRLKKS